MADKAAITPKVLRWARESARIDEETAAKRVNVPVERLREWETGIDQPTIKQAQELAKAYKRPFALLFLSEIPKDFQPLRDFRRKGSKPLGTASVFIIREIQQKQEWISTVNKEDGIQKVSFVGRFTINDDPAKVAADILVSLEIDPLRYTASSPIKEWIDKAETNGVFVSRTSFVHSRLTLDSDEIQGFAIADPQAPFVFVNSDDWDAPQLFTLVHELAHLWIAATGISNEIEHGADNRGFEPVELFCNEVAGSALMPADFMKSLSRTVFDSADQIYNVAKRLGVSSSALLVRALRLRLVSFETYRQLKLTIDRQFEAFLKREAEKKEKQKTAEGAGGPNYYLLQVNRNSRLFTQTVLDAFRGGMIEPTHASSLLNVQVTRFAKLEEQLYR